MYCSSVIQKKPTQTAALTIRAVLPQIFREAKKSDDGTVIMSDSVVQFLLETSDYYDKQDYLELIFKYDYFNYRDIDEFIRKVGE